MAANKIVSGLSDVSAFMPKFNRGGFHLPVISREAQETAARVLQQNHTTHHCFFNHDGFHNHLVHQVLAALSLGAGPKRIQAIYNYQSAHQRPLEERHVRDEMKLHEEDTWNECVGKEDHYRDFMEFFEKEIEQLGMEETFQKYLLADTPRAQDMLNRLYAGFLHPFIHVGYGIEYGIAGILAEGLAQTAIHTNDHAPFFQACADAKGDSSVQLTELLHKAETDTRLDGSAQFSDPNKVRGIFRRAMPAMTEIAGTFRVEPSQIQDKLREVLSFAMAVYAGAPRQDKMLKFDFFLLHCVTSSVFLSVFAQQPWISDENKCRLIERMGWLDLTMYVSRGRPPLHMDEVRNFQYPKEKPDWLEVWQRGVAFDDDGHALKAVRAASNGQWLCGGKTYGWMSDDMWHKAGAMTMKSVEEFSDAHWVHSTGFPEAWAKIPARL